MRRHPRCINGVSGRGNIASVAVACAIADEPKNIRLDAMHFLFSVSSTPIEFLCFDLHVLAVIPELEVKMKSVLTMSGSHAHEVSVHAIFAVVVAGFAMLIAFANLTAPAVDDSCRSTFANRAVVQCAVHAK